MENGTGAGDKNERVGKGRWVCLHGESWRQWQRGESEAARGARRHSFCKLFPKSSKPKEDIERRVKGDRVVTREREGGVQEPRIKMHDALSLGRFSFPPTP